MQSLPHYYKVLASGTPVGNLNVSAEDLPDMIAAPPIGFNGPGDVWSPEDMLMSSVATCTILSFRAISRASRMDWISIECEAKGELSRIDSVTKFTEIKIEVKLIIANKSDVDKAVKLLNKAEATCLISNSLTADSYIVCEIVVQT